MIVLKYVKYLDSPPFKRWEPGLGYGSVQEYVQSMRQVLGSIPSTVGKERVGRETETSFSLQVWAGHSDLLLNK